MDFKKTCVVNTALITFLALPASAFAESQPFIGFGLGGGSVSLELEAEGPGGRFSDDDSEGSGALIFKGGVDRPSERSYAIFQVLPYDDAEVSVLGFSQDWKFHDGPWRPYLGLTIGLATLEWTEDLEITNQVSAAIDGETARSLALGFQGGFLYEASDALNFDISLRAVGTSLETSIELQQSGSTVGVVTQEVDAISSLTLGANFLF